MRNLALHTLTERLSEDGVIDAEEALQLRKAVFPDGVISREEADALIALETRVANSDEAWSQTFVEAIVDHVLQAGTYPGHVDETTVSWLVARLGQTRRTQAEVLLKVLDRSESAPEYLSDFTRQRLSALLAGSPVGAAETELVRRCLYAASGSGRTSVTEAEARWLFALDAESDGRANDPAWSDLFVKGVLNHLMGRKAPALLGAENMLARQAWLESETPGAPKRLLSMFKGGVGGFKNKVFHNTAESWESHYDSENAKAEDDARLTLAEIAWTVGMTREDRKRTANEAALLAEIKKIEAEAS